MSISYEPTAFQKNDTSCHGFDREDQVYLAEKQCTNTTNSTENPKYEVYVHEAPFKLKYNNAVLPQMRIAYETWGSLNEHKDNAVLLFSGLSLGSHAKSTEDNPQPGWWEDFIGPGGALDTNKYFIVSTNNLGGSSGSTGPSTVSPSTGKPYGTSFPVISVEDIVKSNFLILDYLKVRKVYACIGFSLGGMGSLLSAVLFPERVKRIGWSYLPSINNLGHLDIQPMRVITIAACAQAPPSLIAWSHLQRQCIMNDPNWNNGYYYDGVYPKIGMKLSREVIMFAVRSGLEWEERFGRKMLHHKESPTLDFSFEIESYLDHKGDTFNRTLDPNTVLYITKAMDLFDMSDGFNSLGEALAKVTCPVLVIGFVTDLLFPVRLQRSMARSLQDAGNASVTFFELNTIYGHDACVLDLNGIGTALKGFMETQVNTTESTSKQEITTYVPTLQSHTDVI